MPTENNKYVKIKKKVKRGHKQTGINIEFYQHRVIDSENLNLSLLVRDFLDQYLEQNFPSQLKKSKELETLEVENEVH